MGSWRASVLKQVVDGPLERDGWRPAQLVAQLEGSPSSIRDVVGGDSARPGSIFTVTGHDARAIRSSSRCLMVTARPEHTL